MEDALEDLDTSFHDLKLEDNTAFLVILSHNFPFMLFLKFEFLKDQR